MEELNRLQASRRGHRGHLTKLLKKSEEILAQRNKMTDLILASAKSTRDQLLKKSDTLTNLDAQISPKTK